MEPEKDRSHKETIDAFQPFYEEPLTERDALDIGMNLIRLCAIFETEDILHKIIS